MAHLAPQYNFGDVDTRVPRYRWYRAPLNNLSSTSVTFNSSSNQLLEFKISATTCVNLSRSFLSYQYAIPAGAATLYSASFEDGLEFRNITFGSAGGPNVVDVQFVDQYVNSVRPVRTKLSEFLTNDQLCGLYPSNQLANSNLLPQSRNGVITTGTDCAASQNYLEQQHLQIAPYGALAVNVSRYLPLSCFKDTLLGMDKDLVFGTDQYLRLYSNYTTRMGFQTTSPATPCLAANNTYLTGNMTVSNVFLYVCIEENLDIRNSLLQHLASGKIKLSIPYTWCQRYGIAGGSASGNPTLTITKSLGRGLKRIMLVPCNALEFTEKAFDHNNTNGCKINQLQCTMDGRPLSDFVLNIYNPNSSINPASQWNTPPQSFADDWREAQVWQPGSCILSYPHYQSQWAYILQWGIPPVDGDGKEAGLPESCINDYFDLLHSGDHVFSVQANTNFMTSATSDCNTNGQIFYLYLTFIRTLEIQPDGTILSP